MGELPLRVIEALLILVPGAVATSGLFPPRALPLPGRIALTFATGYGVVALVAMVLVSVGKLTLVPFLVLLGLVTIVLTVVALRRGSVPARLRVRWDELRAEPWLLGAGVVLLVGIAWARLPFSGLHSLTSDTPLRYWGDGLEFATEGGVPERTLQWGMSFSPATSKMAFNSFTAVMNLISPDLAFPAIAGVMWLGGIFLAATFWWLAWELGLRFTAVLLPLFTVANVVFLQSELTTDLMPYRAEIFGRIMAFAGLALAISAVRDDRSWDRFVIAGVLLGLAMGTHLVPTAVAIGILFWYCILVLVRERLPARTVLRAVAAVGIAALLLVASWTIPGGDVAFTGTTRPDAGAVGELDPTLLFGDGRRLAIDVAQERTWYTPPDALVTRLAQGAVRAEVSDPWLWIVTAAIALAAFAVFGPRRTRPAGAAGFSLVVNIVVVSLAFSALYSSFALANFGLRRLLDYSSLPVWLLLLLAGELVFIGIQRLRRNVAAPLAFLLAGVLMVVFLPPLQRSHEAPPFLQSEIEELNWVRANTPCDARILSNRRTGGAYQVLTGRVAVNEGMGPFFRPEILEEVNNVLIEMNQFFKKPKRNRDLLARLGIDYVVMARGERGADRNIRTAPGYPQQMDTAPFLELRYEGLRSNIYEVIGVDDDAPVPDTADHPGYVCRRGDIPL